MLLESKLWAKRCLFDQYIDGFGRALANVQAHLGTATAAPAPVEVEKTETMEVDNGGLPEDVVNKMTETSERYVLTFGDVIYIIINSTISLSQGRRKRKPPAEHTPVDVVKTFTQTSTIPSLHTSRSPGITAVDVDHSGRYILTGGNDKHVQIYDKTEEKVFANLTGHTKKITAVKFRGEETEHDVVISASADKHVRVWIPGGNKGYQVGHNINAHSSDATGISVHPSKEYFVSSGLDSKWSFYDFETGKSIVDVVDQETDSG